MTAPEKIPLRNSVAVAGALIGAFMAVLNIQVVNTSLPDIQGGIGAGLDDGGWISTAYLIGEIIVIPLSGWLATVFSLRRYLIANTALFLLFSAACGLATNFPEMVALRALQGFAGGVLIPLGLLCVIMLLPERARPVGFACSPSPPPSRRPSAPPSAARSPTSMAGAISFSSTWCPGR